LNWQLTTGNSRAKRGALGDEIAAAPDAAVVHRVGKVLILWRPRPLDATPPQR
jgi:RNA-binding protein YhbY